MPGPTYKTYTPGLILFFAFFLLTRMDIQAQTKLQAPDWDVLQDRGKLVQANASLRTIDGWTHFYNEESNIILLSLKLAGQDIGSLEGDLKITSGLLVGYGQTANDLSGASYVEKGIWLTMNRYWRIDKAKPIYQPIRVRFYYSSKDYQDLLAGLDQIGLEDKQRGELLFYALTGNSVHPFSSRPESMRAKYVPLRDTLKAEAVPWRPDLYYAEFDLEDLNAGGSGGFLIPIDIEARNVSGRIMRPDGRPVEGIIFPSAIEGASVRSDQQGYYSLANIQPGKDFIVRPSFDGPPEEELTVLDLIGLQKRLDSGEPFEEPWRELAADIDRSGKLDQTDLEMIRNLILARGGLRSERVWRFLPADTGWPYGLAPLRRIPDEFIRINNLTSDQNEVDFQAIKTGDVWQETDFPNDPPVLLDAGFTLGEVETCGGDEDILVDLMVSGFDDVRGFQFSIQWDPESLFFAEAQDFNLPGFDNDCFSVSAEEDGMLSVAWYTTEGSRKTRLRDGSVICRLRFKALGGDDKTTQIVFEEFPTPIQVLRKNLSGSNVLFSAGEVRIKWDTGIEIFEADISDVSCFSNQDGAIDLNISGPASPFTFAWSNGETTEDLSNLLPGTYAVTITSQNKCPLVVDSLVVAEPRVLFLHNVNVRQIQCPGGNDGAISFKTSGGSAPYTYNWNTGSATPWIGNLHEGSYAVTITDTNGCRTTESFEILPPKPLFVNYGISPSTDSFNPNGAIAISDLIGSTPPQQYAWSNGKTGPIVEDLPAGLYQVSVTDAMQCQYLLKFEIEKGTIPEVLDASLPAGSLLPASRQLLKVQSPRDQTVQVRIFNASSLMVWQKVIPLLTGENNLYFNAPEEKGSYLLQIQPRKGSVSSIRFKVE
ncbi:MAG: hypothetical protein GYB31_16715 [Bacteroidetes bacterium]|nr:hypothetical protein [Bacteroidota bacterium]